MGTSGLGKLLSQNCSITSKSLNERSSRSQVKTLRSAVDMSIYLHRFVKKANTMEEFIMSVVSFIMRLKESKIEPIIVLDGKSRKEKAYVIKKRRKQRENLKQRIVTLQEQLKDSSDSDSGDEDKIDIEEKLSKLVKKCNTVRKTHIDVLKQVLTMMGIIYIHATGEADPLCASLVKSGIAHFCLSNDNDMLLYGCPVTYQNFIYNEHGATVTEYKLSNILVDLGITYNQFVDMCILIGTDYNRPFPGINTDLALELVRQYHTIENIIDNVYVINDTIIKKHRLNSPGGTKKWKYISKPDMEQFNYVNVREIITYTHDIGENIQETNYQLLTDEWFYGEQRLRLLEKFLIESAKLSPKDADEKTRRINVIWMNFVHRCNIECLNQTSV